jgi:hypothetical protein
MLKFRELLGVLNADELARWEQIKKQFNKKKLLGGAGENDSVALVVAQMSQFTDGLDAISAQIKQVGGDYAKPQSLHDTTIERMQKIIEGLRAVPVQVEIKVVPVQDEAKSIEKMSPSASPIEIVPIVTQPDPLPKEKE